jgi:glycosyltransferase involved in cell wall biosynthesis
VTIDPSLNDWVQRLKPIGLEKLVYVVDPSDLKGTASRSDARLHFGLPDHAKVVLMFGNIDQRKGVRGLMELLAHTDTPTDIVGLIVGKQSEIAREMIARACIPSQRLVTLDHYVGAEDEWLSFQAADWIWVAYEGFFGPSGVLAQAAQLGKPVIHNGLGLIGYAFAKCEGNKINPNLANLMLSGPMEMQKSSVEFCNLVKIAIADDCKLAQVE